MSDKASRSELVRGWLITGLASCRGAAGPRGLIAGCPVGDDEALEELEALEQLGLVRSEPIVRDGAAGRWWSLVDPEGCDRSTKSGHVCTLCPLSGQ